MRVVSKASASETNRPVITSASVKWPARPGCVIMVKKSPHASPSASKNDTLP